MNNSLFYRLVFIVSAFLFKRTSLNIKPAVNKLLVFCLKMSKISDGKITDRNNEREKLDFEAKQNLLGFFDLLLEIDKRINPEKYKVEIISELREIRTMLQRLLTEKAKKNTTKEVRDKILVIGKLEIIGRDKIEQHGNENTTKIKNIAGNYLGKNWFSMNNPLVWLLVSIALRVILYLIPKILK